MRLFILGLRRSGTTVFWESFRPDRRFACYDEPFNPILNELPAPEPKGTRDEWIALFRRNPERFWRLFSPIAGVEELQESLSDRQREYLEYVVASSENCVMDMTRCHFKLEALREVVPDAFVVHLYRAAAPWVSSHLGARGSGWRGRMRSAIDRLSFFERSHRYGYWGIEQIIADSPETLFGQRAAENHLDPAAVYEMPAIGRMLAYWKVLYDRIERDGPRVFGRRFCSVAFSDFCVDPIGTVRRIYDFIGVKAPALELKGVHGPRPAYREKDLRWKLYGRKIGIAEDSGLLF